MKAMKSFRPYWRRGRVATAAGWFTALAGMAASFVAYLILSLWVSEIPSELRRPVAWGCLMFGIVVSCFVGAEMKRRGKPLSLVEE